MAVPKLAAQMLSCAQWRSPADTGRQRRGEHQPCQFVYAEREFVDQPVRASLCPGISLRLIWHGAALHHVGQGPRPFIESLPQLAVPHRRQHRHRRMRFTQQCPCPFCGVVDRRAEDSLEVVAGCAPGGRPYQCQQQPQAQRGGHRVLAKEWLVELSCVGSHHLGVRDTRHPPNLIGELPWTRRSRPEGFIGEP
jgi:hypothetical protein